MWCYPAWKGGGGCQKRSTLRNQESSGKFGSGLRASSPTRRGDRNQGRYEFRTRNARSDYSATEDCNTRPPHAGLKTHDQKHS